MGGGEGEGHTHEAGDYTDSTMRYMMCGMGGGEEGDTNDD